MPIILEKTDGEVLNLDDSFVVESLDLESAESIQQAVLQHGGKDVSKDVYSARNITVAGYVFSRTPDEYEEKFDIIVGFSRSRDLKLYKEYPYSRYLTLTKLTNVNQAWEEGIPWRVAKVELQFACEDPFWQDLVVQTDVKTWANGDAFTLANPGTVDVFPILTVQGVTNAPRLIFKNVTDNSRATVYSDLAFTLGNTIVINGVVGTVTRGTTNTIRFMTGSFPRLLPGVNTITYSGENIYAQFEYRPRYL